MTMEIKDIPEDPTLRSHEENLMNELLIKLATTSSNFFNEHVEVIDANVLFPIIRDSSFAYLAATIKTLLKAMDRGNHPGKDNFINECQLIFSEYLERLEGVKNVKH
jgi:hypothetical protein